MTTEAERYEKLKEKYNQFKQANGVLRQGLLEKQADCARLEAALKEKEAANRQQLEEIDTLQFQNGRMSKQLGTLTAQVEDLQKQRQQPNGLSVQNFFSGKQQQEDMKKAEGEIRVLRDELVMKIQENEDLHMQMYEYKRVHEEEAQKLRESSSDAGRELEQKLADLEGERSKVNKLSAEVQDLTQRVSSLNDELSTSTSLVSSTQQTLEEVKRESKDHIDDLHAQLSRWVPFDEARYVPWKHWNFNSQHGREAYWRGEALKQFQSGACETCGQASSVFEAWAKTFSSGSDSEPANRLRVRAKMSDMAERLATIMSETLPNVIGNFGPSQLRPELLLDRHVNQSVRTLLTTQRKWVVYQSLLLLHDPAGAMSTRSAQEEAQAHSFVDCLWRVHHAVRTLFARVRLVACLLSLTTHCGSSMHFQQAREAMRRGSRRKSGPKMQSAASGKADDSCSAGPEAHLATKSCQVMERVRTALKDVVQSWEGVGRCLSLWATAQGGSAENVPEEGSGVLSLLEALHKLCDSMSKQLLPATAHILSDVPGAVGGLTVTTAASAGSRWRLARKPNLTLRSEGISRGGLCEYSSSAVARLQKAPGSIGFDESLQTQLFARKVCAEKLRLTNDVRQQMKRLREVSDEKADLADEFRVLQDSHALLRSNIQVLESKLNMQRREDDKAGIPQVETKEREPRPGELLVTSRQRALLDSLAVTSQENSGLRQHGFFVEMLSLTAGEAALAAGPPDMDAYEAWEMSVRKVYEQHARNLQMQVRAADSKAKELYVNVQENIDLLRKNEQEKQELRDEMSTKEQKLKSVQEDIVTTRKNYDHQLAMLTEHICSLASRLSEKDDGVASLHSNKILCGHCGMWNTMGKLLSSETGGKCHTCKEKLLCPS